MTQWVEMCSLRSRLTNPVDDYENSRSRVIQRRHYGCTKMINNALYGERGADGSGRGARINRDTVSARCSLCLLPVRRVVAVFTCTRQLPSIVLTPRPSDAEGACCLVWSERLRARLDETRVDQYAAKRQSLGNINVALLVGGWWNCYCRRSLKNYAVYFVFRIPGRQRDWSLSCSRVAGWLSLTLQSMAE